MSRLFCIVAVSILFTVPAATRAADDADPVRQSIEAKKQTDAINADRSKATDPLNAKRYAADDLLRALKDPPKPDMIAARTKDLEQLKADLARLQARIDSLQAFIDAGNITDPAARQAKAAEVQASIQVLDKQIVEAGKPFNDRTIELRKRYPDRTKDVLLLIDPLMKDGSGPTEGAKHDPVSGNFYDGFFSVRWMGQDKKQVAWAHLRAAAPPTTPPDPKAQMVDGKYVISSLGSNTVWVQVGNFVITFVADKPDLQTSEKVKEALKSLVDLEGLAKLGKEK